MLVKQTPTQINYNAFSKLRVKCKSRSKLYYNNYIFILASLLMYLFNLFLYTLFLLIFIFLLIGKSAL